MEGRGMERGRKKKSNNRVAEKGGKEVPALLQTYFDHCLQSGLTSRQTIFILND